MGGLQPEVVENLIKIAHINDPVTLAVADALDRYGVLQSKEEIITEEKRD